MENAAVVLNDVDEKNILVPEYLHALVWSLLVAVKFLDRVVKREKKVLLPFKLEHHPFDCLQQPKAVFCGIVDFKIRACFNLGAHRSAALPPDDGVHGLEVAVKNLVAGDVTLHSCAPHLLLEFTGGVAGGFARFWYCR
jgi:hypothetical protein